MKARLLLLLFLLSVPAHADSIRYTINFTTAIGSATPTGSFVYDDVSQVLTELEIRSGEVAFQTYQWHTFVMGGPCLEGKTGGAVFFSLLSGDCGTHWSTGLAASDIAYFSLDGGSAVSMVALTLFEFPHFPATGAGAWTITPVSEPSVLSLVLTGLSTIALAAGKPQR